jgi:hypothetical protein
MKPLFTIHAGEYLVGAHIEKNFKRASIWIPLRDTGVDLLVTDKQNRACISLQVKFSKDFLVTHVGREFQKKLRACGWWSIDREKLAKSPADYWVFVLQGFANRSTDFVVVPRDQLLNVLGAIHGSLKRIQVYIWVTKNKKCWETRELSQADKLRVRDGVFSHPHRDLTRWLNNWRPLMKLDR